MGFGIICHLWALRERVQKVGIGQQAQSPSIESILLKYCDEILQPPFRMSAYVMEELKY